MRIAPDYRHVQQIIEAMKQEAFRRSTYFLYIIGKKNGPIKVGISASPWGRLRQIQTGCHFVIELLHTEPMLDRDAAREHERIFHEIWDEKRLSGEWFDMDFDLALEQIDNGFEAEAYIQARREINCVGT